MSTTPLGQLLKQSYVFCITHWKTILIAAIIAGSLTALIKGSFMSRADQIGSSMMENMGMDLERMEALSKRMQQGDDTAAEEMEQMFAESFGDLDDDATQDVVRSVMLKQLRVAAPYIGLSALIGLILTVIVNAYYLLLALGKGSDPVTLAKRSLGLFFPLLGVWVWSFLRSFIWVPIIGIIPAIILAPRFALSSVILVQENKGVMKSVSESYRRTSGYWGKIVGNMIVMVLCLIAVGFVAAILTSIIAAALPVAGVWLESVLAYVYMAFATVFMVKLALTIMAKDKAPVAAAPKKAVSKPVATKKAPVKKAAAKKSVKKVK